MVARPGPSGNPRSLANEALTKARPDGAARSATYGPGMDTTHRPDPRLFDSLVDLLDDAATRYPPDRALLSLRTDDGMEDAWSAFELRRRARIVAWRLRAAGLSAGDRLLTWSPSTPGLPAVYWGAMLAGIVFVPLDMRMAPSVLQRIAKRSDGRLLAVGGGDAAPDVVDGGLSHLDRVTLETLVADPEPDDAALPSDWEAQLDRWPRPGRASLVEIVYTSGTTSTPKGVQLTHGTFLSTLEVVRKLVPERQHRIVGILPLSHLFEQAPLLFYATSIGAEVLYVRSRNPRVIFEALREQRVTVMVLTPQILELFWSALTREVEKQGKSTRFARARSIARRLPYRLRRVIFQQLHAQLGGELRVLVSAGAYLPPDLQSAWEDVGIAVVQGYGSTECGIVTANDEGRHPPGKVGRVRLPSEVKLHPATSEILVKGPNTSSGYWHDDEATAASRDEDGWTLTGDSGHFTDDGDLVLSGRLRNIIVLPNGLNVYPEDIESALTDHGLTQTVVLETEPGRIEAVVLPPGSTPTVRADTAPIVERSAAADAAMRTEIERVIKAANSDLSVHQRIAGWRLWPEPDFPRTHTLKIRRNEVRTWAGDDIGLQVRETEDAEVDPAAGPT
jgi:long-chain acyl-CoA synthetase